MGKFLRQAVVHGGLLFDVGMSNEAVGEVVTQAFKVFKQLDWQTVERLGALPSMRLLPLYGKRIAP
jgi:hypothetical protein